MSSRLAFLVSACSLLGLVTPSQAQDAGCDPLPELGPIEVTPADGASGVRVNSFVRVRYSPGYFGGATMPTEDVTLTGPAGDVTGQLQLAGDDTLYFVPSADLTPSSTYSGTATGAAFPFEFTFQTGTGQDAARPDLRNPGEDDAFAVDSSAAEGGCFAAGSRRIRLSFTSARDDGPESSIEYWVYLTRGEGVESPRLLTRVRDYGAAVTTLGLVLPPEQSVHAACVTLVAVDGVDRASQWSSPACFDPHAGTGFVALCSASPGASPSAAALMLGIVLGLAARRARALTRASRS